VKSRTLGVIAAVVALPTIVAVVPSRLDGVTTSWTRASTNTVTATLVGVKVLTMADEPSTAVRDATRTATGRRFGAQCTNPGPGTRAYNLRGIRVSGPTTAHLDPAGAPAGAASAFQAAFNTWHAADPNAPSISVVTDSSVSSPQADGRYELMFAPLGGRTLAVTYTWTRRGVAESDVVFNNKASFFMAPGEGDGCYEGVSKYDLQNVATHEFGHVYGLDHVSATYNTMAPTATLGETYERSLASGDAAGLRAIYH
jgi:hypothetical protein